MNWEAIGAVGEVLGAIAVIATLLYLANQTRHTRTAVEVNSNMGTVEAHSRFRQSLIGNTELANLLAKANSRAELTEGEQIQISLLFFELFIACGIGVLTQVSKDGTTPRAEYEFLTEFLEENPSGFAQWKRRHDTMEKVVPEFCAEIDKFVIEYDDT